MLSINKKNHFDIIDVIRGFAILLMFIYHFSYDLDYFNFLQLNFATDGFWLNFRTLIVTLFLTVMGISLYLASYRGLNKKHFQRRLVLLIVYSILVSISSWLMFPTAMIFFGILHFIAVASVLGLLFVRLGILNLLLGLSFIMIAQFIEHPIFDLPYLRWFGLMTTLPIAVDYVPLLPWFGVVLIGIYMGQILSQRPAESFFPRWKSNDPLSKVLALGGRHSLHIYMLHQPLFLGILYIIKKLIG
jgi:uncharacterized membrane protein